MEKKSYKNLEELVWNTDACSGCGACIAVCPADALYYREGDTHPVSFGYCKQETDNVPCGACFEVCPRVPEKSVTVDAIGNYLSLFGAKATTESPLYQSGGAVTAILAYGLQNNLIDAVVTVTEDRWLKKPRSTLITSAGEILSYAGSRYSWYTPVLSALKTAVIERKYRAVAVVGVPCAVSALRLMKESDHDLIQPYARAIRLIIGLFCTEIFDYHLFTEGLQEKMRAEPWDITRMDIKGGLIIEREGLLPEKIDLSSLSFCVRKGCHICRDFTAVDADISVGSMGTPDGYTTLIVRTPVGKGFLDSAVRGGSVILADNVSPDPILSHAKKKSDMNRLP